jgi:hypothetical protein
MAQKKKVSRKEQRAQQIDREKRMRMLRIWLPVAAIVLVFAGFLVMRLLESDVEGVRFIDAAPSGQHVAELDFPIGGLPPMGGPHYGSWQNCGIYETPIDPGHAIHSMEHGAIWITYRPDLPSEQIADLQDRTRGQSYLLLSPYPEQSSAIALTGWDVQLTAESTNDERIDQFISRYRGARGPERGASCAGGVGEPVG